MAATTRCRYCGGDIEISETGAPAGVIAIGDQFLHQGCMTAHHGDDDRNDTPAYHVPRS